MPWCIISTHSSSVYLPMPVSGSGVMLAEYSTPMPIGILNGRPPTHGVPLGEAWQAAQSAARVRYSPRVTRSASAARKCPGGEREQG